MVAKPKHEEIIKIEQNLEKIMKKEGFLTRSQAIKLIETETNLLVEEYIKDFVVNNLILSPATKRRAQWINEYLSKAVQTIAEKAAPSVVENLYKNESFLTVVLQATSIALRNHQKEKLEALRNAIVNSVWPNAPDDDLKLMFINFIDSFTLTHLVILDFIDNPLAWCQTKNLIVDNSMFQYRAGSTAQDSNKLSESTQTFLIKIFPGIDNQVYFYDQVLQDLMSKGLVDGGSGANISVLDLHGTAFSTTNMGKLFKRFVLSFPITEISV
jgi:hypothetical protein